MTTQRDGRSRELRYYHRRRERGDHLFRLWADGETSSMFKELSDGEGSESVFRRMVRDMWRKEVRGDL